MPCKWARPCFGISAGIWDMTSEIAAAQCGSLAEGSLAVAVLRACGLVGLAVNGRERRVDDARNYTLRRGGHAFWRPDSGAICNLSEGCLGQSSAATHVLTRRDIQRWTKVTGEESRWEERGEAKRSANSSIRPQPARIALTVGLEEASERRTGDGLIVAAVWEVKRRRDGSMGPPPAFGTFGLARVGAQQLGRRVLRPSHLLHSYHHLPARGGEKGGGAARRRMDRAEEETIPHGARFTMG